MSDISKVAENAIKKKAMDITLKGSFMTMRFMSNAKEFETPAEEQTLQISMPENGGWFSGMKRFDVEEQDNEEIMVYDPAFIYQSVVISGTKRAKLAGAKNKSVNYVAYELEKGANAIKEKLASAIMGNGPTHDNPDVCNGLGNIIDDGTTYDEIGGLSRAELAAVKAQRNTLALASFTNANILDTVNDACTRGNKTPDLHVTTKTIWTKLSQQLTPTQRQDIEKVGYQQATRMGVVANKAALGALVGFNSINYRGGSVVADEYTQSGRWYQIHEPSIGWHGMSDLGDPDMKVITMSAEEIKGVYEGMESKNVGLHFTDFKKPVDQWGDIAQYIGGGQMESYDPALNGVIIFT